MSQRRSASITTCSGLKTSAPRWTQCGRRAFRSIPGEYAASMCATVLHEAHAGTAGGLADHLGVVAVVLGALDEGLDVLRWDQVHGVAKGGQHSSPVMRTGARFQGDLGRGQLLEEGDHLRAAKIGSQHRMARLVDAMQREHSLGRVDANATNLGHGRLRSWWLTTQFWHSMPWGRPPNTEVGHEGVWR